MDRRNVLIESEPTRVKSVPARRSRRSISHWFSRRFAPLGIGLGIGLGLPGGGAAPAPSINFATLFTGVLQSVQTDRGLTYGTTPLRGGGATDVVTLGGTGMTRDNAVPIRAKGTGAGVVSIYYDGGTTPVATGVTPVAGTPVALTGAAAGLTLTWATVGAIALNQTWDATCAGLQDQSGNGKHYTQPTAAFQPVITIGNNGKCALLFDGVDDYLVSSLVLPTPGVTPYYLAAVFRQVTWTSGRRLFGTQQSTSGHMLQGGTTPTIGIYNGNSASSSNALPIGQYGACEALFSATTADYIRLGAGSVVAGVATGFQPPSNTVYIGCRSADLFANIEFQSLTYATGGVPATWRPAVNTMYGTAVATGQAIVSQGTPSMESSGAPFVQGPMAAPQITVLIGQSNAGGRDTVPGAFVPNTSGVTFYNPTLNPFDSAHVFTAGMFGPALELGNRLKIATPGGGPAILANFAIGGTALDPAWWNGSVLNATCATMLHAIRTLGPTKADVIWIQGETETADAAYAPGNVQATYQASLAGLAGAIRAELPGITVRFYIVKINANWGAAQVNYAAMVAAQTAFVAADGNAELISLDDLNLIGNIHYINGDQIIVGERMAGRVIKANS